jgi:heme/copper-type cytochrome/quinol oxidase subunit 4
MAPPSWDGEMKKTAILMIALTLIPFAACAQNGAGTRLAPNAHLATPPEEA